MSRRRTSRGRGTLSQLTRNNANENDDDEEEEEGVGADSPQSAGSQTGKQNRRSSAGSGSGGSSSKSTSSNNKRQIDDLENSDHVGILKAEHSSVVGLGDDEMEGGEDNDYDMDEEEDNDDDDYDEDEGDDGYDDDGYDEDGYETYGSYKPSRGPPSVSYYNTADQKRKDKRVMTRLEIHKLKLSQFCCRL